MPHSITVLDEAVCCRISSVALWLHSFIRASGIVGSASPGSSVAPAGRWHLRRCIRRQRRPGGRDRRTRVAASSKVVGSAARGRSGGSGKSVEALHRRSALPNKCLHLTPRQVYRGWVLRFIGVLGQRQTTAFPKHQSFRGAGEAGTLGGNTTNSRRVFECVPRGSWSLSSRSH